MVQGNVLVRALIISDLHANLEAVKALPSDVGQIWVLGDLVNCGPSPAEVIEYVREKATFVVRGNHDNFVGSGEDPRCSKRFRAMAQETGSFTQAVLNQEQKRYLLGLPLTTTLAADGAQVLMCHGVPADPLFQYRPEDSPLWLADPVAATVNVELVGHTHVPFQRFIPPRRIVNPGSVGQPKHGRAEACYAVWEDGKITLGSVAYDFEETISKLRRLRLSQPVYEDLAFALRNGKVPASRDAVST
jgi:protein phosphatase